LGDDEVRAKFLDNAAHGGLSPEVAAQLLQAAEQLLTRPIFAPLLEFRT
jgi:hypothetical protein